MSLCKIDLVMLKQSYVPHWSLILYNPVISLIWNWDVSFALLQYRVIPLISVFLLTNEAQSLVYYNSWFFFRFKTDKNSRNCHILPCCHLFICLMWLKMVTDFIWKIFAMNQVKILRLMSKIFGFDLLKSHTQAYNKWHMLSHDIYSSPPSYQATSLIRPDFRWTETVKYL